MASLSVASMADLLSWSVFILVLQALLAGYGSVVILQWLHGRRIRVRAPRVGKNPWTSGLWRARADFVRNGKRLTSTGYARYKESLWWIQTGDMERLVIPNRYIDELRKLPESHLDSRMAVVERNLGWYTGVDIILKSTAHVDVCRTQLVQNLDRITDAQISELTGIFQQEIGPCFEDQNFHFLNAADTFLNIVSRSMVKCLVDGPLCHDDQWLQAILDTTVNTGRLCRELQRWPDFLRPVVYRFKEARRKLDRNNKVAQEMLTGIVRGRKKGDDNVDILQWLIDSSKGDETPDLSFLTRQVIFVAIAATRSTASSCVNTLFDLIAYAQYQKPLRQEIEQALLKHGGWSSAVIKDLRMLDSFMKESQRLHHHLLLSFNRKVRKPVTLSNGVTIPEGTFISTAAYWAARDPAEFPPTGKGFEPWRWLKLREDAERQGQSIVPYLASTPSPHNLHWGYGRNACPGRFMAATEVKLILAWVLWHFDIAFPEGQTQRPESVFLDERVHPDPSQRVGFRPRRPMGGKIGS